MCSPSKKPTLPTGRDKVDGPQNKPKWQNEPEFALFEPMKHGDIESAVPRRPYAIRQDSPKKKHGCCNKDRHTDPNYFGPRQPHLLSRLGRSVIALGDRSHPLFSSGRITASGSFSRSWRTMTSVCISPI